MNRVSRRPVPRGLARWVAKVRDTVATPSDPTPPGGPPDRSTAVARTIDGIVEILRHDPTCRDAQRIVAVAARRPILLGNELAAAFPTSTVDILVPRQLSDAVLGKVQPRVTVTTCGNLEAVHARLNLLPAPDLFLDFGAHRRARILSAFRELLFHVADGGAYVLTGLDESDDRDDRDDRGGRVDGDAQGDEPNGSNDPNNRDTGDDGDDASSDVARWLADMLRLKARPDLSTARDVHRHDRAIATALHHVTDHGAVVVVGKQGEFLRKLGEDETTDVLTAAHAERWGEVVDVRPPLELASRARVSTNLPERATFFAPTMTTAALYLRRYRDVVCAPRQLAVLGDAMLPNSFHQPIRPALISRSPATSDAGRWFTTRPAVAGLDSVDGPCYHLDSEFPGHFGHFMTQDIGKLWGLAEACERDPDVRILLSTPSAHGSGAAQRPASFQLAVLGALGITPDRIVVIDRPVRVGALYGATSMFYNARYVHPDLPALWDRLGAAIAAPDRADLPRRIYVSRRGQQLRACVNEDVVEELFVAHGFTVLHPETMAFADQVAVFAQADAVAGCAGSGMFTMMFCERPGLRIVLGSDRYRAKNEYTISAVRGDDYHHFFCPAQTQAFHSAFEFDVVRDGAELERLLETVD